MFMNFRRIHKCQCVQLLTTGLLLCVVMVWWEELDHHMTHVKSFMYRYLINSFVFLSSSLMITSSHHHGKDASNSVNGAIGNYPYLINHPNKCGGGGEDGETWDDVLLLLFVKSSPENVKQRQTIRDTWGNESFVRSKLGVSIKVVFVLGIHPDVMRRSRMQAALLQEDHAYGDLIQQDFVDTFYNLTTKLILQFHWGHEYCPLAQFFMSADDDVFIHMPNLVRYLQQVTSSQSGAKDMWVGHVHRASPPVRYKKSKYHVPYDLYPWPSYPDYTAGAGYVVSGNVAAKIYHATLMLNSSLYIDDVFMGICANIMGISPQEHVYFSGGGKAPYHPSIFDYMITSHGHATDMHSFWQAATDPTVSRSCKGYMGNLYCSFVRVMLLCLPRFQNTYSCMAAFT